MMMMMASVITNLWRSSQLFLFVFFPPLLDDPQNDSDKVSEADAIGFSESAMESEIARQQSMQGDTLLEEEEGVWGGRGCVCV